MNIKLDLTGEGEEYTLDMQSLTQAISDEIDTAQGGEYHPMNPSILGYFDHEHRMVKFEFGSDLAHSHDFVLVSNADGDGWGDTPTRDEYDTEKEYQAALLEASEFMAEEMAFLPEFEESICNGL